MTTVHLLEAVAGLIIILLIFYDLFQSVVLPRPAVRKTALLRIIIRPMWRMWRWLSERSPRLEQSEGRLAAFGPIALLTLFTLWGLALVIGYGLIVAGLRDQFRPVPADLAECFYVSATTLVPLSYGDIIPVGGLARLAIIAESATGVALAALAITLLFSLYESFRSREEQVIALDALAGAPPSGVQILETAAEHHMRRELIGVFDEWRKWSAMVLESHLAYPLLIFFRSSHDNEAWVNSFGAVMDAANLVMTTVEEESQGPALLMFTVGYHLVEDITWFFTFKSMGGPIVERDEFELAVKTLTESGYNFKTGDKLWEDFSHRRSKYASTLNQMAHLLAIPPAQWIGDRSYLPHRERRPLRRRRPTAAGS